jgi:hypothetical protein
LIRRFARDRWGQIALLFAIGAMPVLVAASMALDMSNAANLRSKLQAAADAAVLAGATRLAVGAEDADKEDVTPKTFEANPTPYLLSRISGAPAVAIDFPEKIVQISVAAETRETDPLAAGFAADWEAAGYDSLPCDYNDLPQISQAGANIVLSARKTEPFKGIAVGQHPDSVPDKENLIIGGGQMEINGILYFPKQPLKITGDGDIGATISQFAIIADTIAIEGNGQLNIEIGENYREAGLPDLAEADEIVRLLQ